MRFDQGPRGFVGTVRDTASQTVGGVRVEIHLSNGVELGPTRESTEQQHPEVAARRQVRPTHSVRVELRALLFDERIEVCFVQHAIQALVSPLRPTG